MNKLVINGYTAIIAYDEDIDMFRGEFIGINGGADFYASDIASLHREAEISLNIFLDVCKQKGISPNKAYSGKFNTRIDPELHKQLAIVALTKNMSINDVVVKAIQAEISSSY